MIGGKYFSTRMDSRLDGFLFSHLEMRLFGRMRGRDKIWRERDDVTLPTFTVHAVLEKKVTFTPRGKVSPVLGKLVCLNY